MHKIHDREKDGYNNEMMFCLKPIYSEKVDDAPWVPDVVNENRQLRNERDKLRLVRADMEAKYT